MREPRVLLLLALISACSDSARMLGPRVLGPTTYDVNGLWRIDETIENATAGVSCAAFGPVTVTQDGPRFTALGTESGSCRGPGGTESFTDEPFTIADGTIDGTAIAFHIDECTYAGMAHGAKPDSATGTVTCRIEVGTSVLTFTGSWHVIPPPDDQPPTVAGTTLGGGANGTLETGDDTVYVRIVAADNTALRAIGYEITDPSRGQVVRRDSLVLSADTVTALDDTLVFPLPLNLMLPVPDGTPFQGSVFARDTAANTATAVLAPINVRYPNPPNATGSLTGSTRPDSTGALRDTLEIRVVGSSPRPLTYIGYRVTSLASFGDSVLVTDTAAAHVFRLPVPFEWKGLLLTFEVFGRDRLVLEDREAIGQRRVVVFPSRPTQTLRVGQGVSDVVYDAPRGRAYLMTALDSTVNAGRPEVRVYQFSSAGFLPGIPLPWFADGMDLSPGGDSLLLTLYNGRLGIVDLTTLAQDSTDLIAYTPGGGRYPFKVRAVANGKAMVSITGGSAPGQLVEYDLGTGTQTLRTDVGAGGDIGVPALLGRTPDRTRLLVFPSSATASAAQLYRSDTDTFAASVSMPVLPVGATSVSSDAAGSLWLVGNQLLDSALAWRRQLSTGIYAGASVLSHDGVYAYVAVAEGVVKVHTADGVEVEPILLQEPPYRLSITPDGNTLIAIGFGLQIIDLR